MKEVSFIKDNTGENHSWCRYLKYFRMIFLYTFICLVFALPNRVNSQSLCDWVLTSGSSQNDYMHAVTTDSQGNILLGVSFSDTLVFGLDTAFSMGNQDGLIVKISPAGVILWAQQIAGLGDNIIHGISCDAGGNVYVTGSFSTTAFFGASISRTGQGGADFFAGRISSAGSWQWVTNSGDALFQSGYDIEVSPWGDVIVGGAFEGKMHYNNDSLVSSGQRDGFIGSIQSGSGNWKWLRGIHGTADISVLSLDAHLSQGIVIGGVFSSTANFGSTGLNSSGGTDGFISTLDSTGSYQWAIRAGGNFNDSVNAVGFIASGKIFVSGSFRGTALFGSTLHSSSGGSDMFTGLLNNTGGWFWSVPSGGSNNVMSKALSIDASGSAVIGGEFQGLASFGTTSLVSAGGRDIFLSRIDTAGVWQWAFRQGGSGHEYLSNIAVSPNHFIYISGFYDGIMNVNSASYPSNGGSDMYLMAVDRNAFGWGRSFSVSSAGTIMCGDTITLIATPNDPLLNYSWTPAADIVNPSLRVVDVYPAATTYIKAIASLSGCVVSDSVLVTVDPLPLSAGSDQNMFCGGTVQLNAVLSTPVSGAGYAWSPTASLSDPNIHNPFATPHLTTIYTVTATKGQCNSVDSMTVHLDPLPFDSICLVTVDDTLNKNLIIFEKHTIGPIAYYKVYRETTVANVYDSIGIVHPDSVGFFIDMNSNPNVKADRYRISTVDSCGFESNLSPMHKTMHLSINQGVGSSWNLIWSVYEGFNVPTYRIWRGTTIGSLNLIDSVPGTSMSYTDANPPTGGLYYMVEVVAPKICYPYTNTKAATSYNSSRSNQADNGLIQPDIINASFSASPVTGVAPLTVNFIDNSTGMPTNWLWVFGDGDSSHVQNPVHTYNTVGLFTVKLVAWNNNYIDSVIEVDFIAVSSSVSEHDLNSEFKVFPNPLSEGKLNIVSGLMPIESIRLTDISGRTVLYFEGVGRNEFEISSLSLSKGIYIIQTSLKNGSLINRKLIVK